MYCSAVFKENDPMQIYYEDVTSACVVSALHTYDIEKTRLRSLIIIRSILVLE